MDIHYTTCCPSLWQVLIYQLQYQKIAFNIDFLFVTFLVFPAWEPSSNDVLCAKFLYFYRSKCFDPNVEDKIDKQILEKRDAERLQSITNSSDVFTNLFHEFFSVKENKLLFGPKQRLFFSVCQLKKES